MTTSRKIDSTLKSNTEHARLVNISWSCFFCHFPFMFNHHNFYDRIQFKVCINVYRYIKVYMIVKCSIFCELKFNQAEAYGGHLSNVCLGQCGITAPTNQSCDWKSHDFHSHIPPPPTCTAENRRRVTMKLYQGADQLPLSSCFPSAKQCVEKGLQPSKRPQKWRVQASKQH